MSPHLRSMLEDAADDSGRPANLDLNAVRAGGRRATWRRRATVGGLGVGVTAVIATVAITVGGAGLTAQGPLRTNLGPADQADARSVLEAAGLNDSALALIEAIRDAGYDIDLGAAGGSGSGSVSGSGSESVSGSGSGSVSGSGSEAGAGVGSSSAATTFRLVRVETAGSVVVEDFTAVALLTDEVSAADPPTDGAAGPACAVTPPSGAQTQFRWSACHKEPTNDGEIWSSDGSGPGLEAVGATLVRGDGSGFSITLATTPSDFGWFAYSPLPSEGPAGPAASAVPPLTDLPLTAEELAAVVAEMASFDEPLQADFHDEPSLAGDTAMPSPAPTVEQTTGTPAAPDGQTSTDCSQGDLLTTMTDEQGHTDLVDQSGRTLLCSYRFAERYASDVIDITDRTNMVALPSKGASPDDSWHFSPQTDMVCDPPASCAVVGLGYGEVPTDVARITFAQGDGIEVDAAVAGTWWFFRFPPSASGGLETPAVVRLYDSADRLLAIGEPADQQGIGPASTATPAEPVDGG